jgi:hypothetical protein
MSYRSVTRLIMSPLPKLSPCYKIADAEVVSLDFNSVDDCRLCVNIEIGTISSPHDALHLSGVIIA